MLTFLRLIARLPLPLLHLLGAKLGLLALLRGRHRRLIAENLRHAGLYSPFRVLRVGMELGKMVVELPAIWLRPPGQATGWIREVRGWEHVEAGLQRGKGLIVLGPHLGCFELAGLYLALRVPINVMYRQPSQEWVHELMQRGRNGYSGRAVQPDVRGVRTLYKALRHNEVAWILPDQHANDGDGVWTPFLSRWAYMPTLLYRLQSRTHANLLLFYCERLSWGRGFRFVIEPLPELPEDTAQAMRIVNGAMEARIRQLPEQYLWSYRLHRISGDQQPPEGPAR